MKRISLLCLMLSAVCVPSLVFAQVNVENNTGSNAQSGATAIAYGGGTNSPSKIRTTVPGIAPGLVAAGVHSCAGSSSVGVGATGWGFGLGSTYEMKECNRRAYAAALLGMGQNRAALDLICLNKEVRSVLNATGVACPSQRLVSAQAAPSSSGSLMPASTMRVATASTNAAVPATQQKRRYSAKALGLSSADLKAKGCVLRKNGTQNVWHCSQPVM